MFASIALAAAITTAPVATAPTQPRPEFQQMINEIKVQVDDILRENDAIVAKILNA